MGVLELRNGVFMIVRFLYYDKQVAAYHRNFFGANGLGINGIYVIYAL